MTTTTAIYTRISADHTGESLGVQRQYDSCLELANRLGWNVTHHFDDNDISAYNGKRRPGFEALLDAMKDGAIDSFICWHTDRLYRSWKDLLRLVEIMRAGDIECQTVVSGPLDLSTASGRQMASILCAVNVGELEHKSERHKLANAQARAAGKWRNGGAAVFGYDSKGAIVEHEGVLIRAAAKDLLAGRSLRSLAREWNDRGITTRRGGKWSAIGFRLMISNPRYAALVTHKGQVVGKGLWEAIIDHDTHLAITAMLADPTRLSHHSFERVYPGSGVYVCGECGGKLRPVSSKPYKSRNSEIPKTVRSYGCPACFKVSCKVEMLDTFVADVILGMLTLDGDRISIGTDKEDVAELARRRDGLQERLNELGRMFAHGDIDGEQLRSGSAELHSQLAGINSLLAGLLRTSPAANLLHAEGDLRAKWDATTPEMRGRIIDELVTVTVRRVGQSRGRWGKIEDRVDIDPK